MYRQPTVAYWMDRFHGVGYKSVWGIDFCSCTSVTSITPPLLWGIDYCSPTLDAFATTPLTFFVRALHYGELIIEVAQEKCLRQHPWLFLSVFCTVGNWLLYSHEWSFCDNTHNFFVSGLDLVIHTLVSLLLCTTRKKQIFQNLH